MRAPLLSTLVLLNAGLALAIGWIGCFAPPLADDAAAPIMAQRPLAEAEAKPIAEADEEIGGGLRMFGSRSSPAQSKETPRPAIQLPAEEGNFKLLGILLREEGTGPPATIILLKHGLPPVTTRLSLGGTVEGWRLASASRTSVDLLKPDGTRRVLWLGKPPVSLAPKD